MNYTRNPKKAINIAQCIATEYSNAEFSSAHMLKALLPKEIGLIELLLSRQLLAPLPLALITNNLKHINI